MLLELDYVNGNVIEWSAGLISARTAADVFLHLALYNGIRRKMGTALSVWK
jgi:hypothetical protein